MISANAELDRDGSGFFITFVVEEGQLFSFTGAPNRYGLDPFYELHVWAWKANPRGAFADMNPQVSCEHAGVHGK